MIEEVLDVGPKRGCDTFSEAEIFVKTQIHSPRAGPIQKVALCEFGIAEYVGTNGRKSKRIGVPDLVTTTVIHIADHHRSIRWAIEISDSDHRPTPILPNATGPQSSQIQKGVKAVPVLANMLKLVCHPPINASAQRENPDP